MKKIKYIDANLNSDVDLKANVISLMTGIIGFIIFLFVCFMMSGCTLITKTYNVNAIDQKHVKLENKYMFITRYRAKKMCERLDIDIKYKVIITENCIEIPRTLNGNEINRIKCDHYTLIPINRTHINMTYFNWLGIEKRVIKNKLADNLVNE